MRGGEQGIYKSDADPVQFYSTALDQSISLLWPLAVLSSETFIQQTSQAQGLPLSAVFKSVNKNEELSK